MSNFWENIFRYPKFFISSVIGLITVIISPFQRLVVNPNTRIFSIIGFITVILITSSILLLMLEG